MIDRYKMAGLVVAAVAALAISFSAGNVWSRSDHWDSNRLETPMNCPRLEREVIKIFEKRYKEQIRLNKAEDVYAAASWATIYNAFCKK